MPHLQISLAGLGVFHHDCSWSLLVQGARRWRGNVLIFGKPLVGKPMAAEAMSTEPMTSRFGCGSAMFSPTCLTSGRTMRAATV